MSINFQTIKSDFVKYLTETGKSEPTIEIYSKHVERFKEYLKKRSVFKTNQSDIHKFRMSLVSELKKSTVNQYLIGLKVFFDFLQRKYSFVHNLVFPQYKLPMKNGREHDFITPDEFDLMMDEAEKAEDKRFIALVKVLLYTGSRISEALQLQISDVGKDFIIVKGKGDVERYLYLTNIDLKNALSEYLAIRQQPYSSTTKALFVGERGPITRHTAHSLIKKYAKAAGIDTRKTTTHAFRQLFVRSCFKNGIPLEDISRYLGHRDINSTLSYFEKEKSEYGEMIKAITFTDYKKDMKDLEDEEQ